MIAFQHMPSLQDFPRVAFHPQTKRLVDLIATRCVSEGISIPRLRIRVAVVIQNLGNLLNRQAVKSGAITGRRSATNYKPQNFTKNQLNGKEKTIGEVSKALKNVT